MTDLLLVEDHPIYAEALIQVLEKKDDLTIILVVDTAEKALQMMSGLNPDLILVDVSLPKMNGIDFIRKLHKIYPEIPCLLISGHISNRYLQRGLDAGARGYAIKDDAIGIIDGIYQVLRGEIYISKELRTA
jgi:DNA-binding NarL/FixJ family response regulator